MTENNKNRRQNIEKMFKQLQLLILKGKLKPPTFKIVPIHKYREAIENTNGNLKILR